MTPEEILADIIRETTLKERERCARIAETYRNPRRPWEVYDGWEIADAIRRDGR